VKKKELRKKYAVLREKMTLAEIENQSLDIANNVLGLPIWDHTNYHIFLPIEKKKEVQTEHILHVLYGKDKSLIVPKVNFETGALDHFLLQENTIFRVSTYGIPEPVSGIQIPSDQIDVIFVPLLAFDRQGNRTGYGKGFYDAFLHSCKQEAIFVGLSFFEAEENIENHSHDIPLHFCITPKNIYKF